MRDNSATAMVFTGLGQPFKKEELPVPVPEPYEILVRVAYTTICSSDLHTHTGKRSTLGPCVMGHEIVGEIVNKGKNMQGDYNGDPLQIGDYITWCVYAYEPGNDMAVRGFPQKSTNLYKYGHHQFTLADGLNGGFASHCLLKKGTAVFKLPAFINGKVGAPINCTHATIAAAIRMAGSVKDKNVLVSGVGMLGLSACAMAKEEGARHVYALDWVEGRLDFAQRFGATRAFNSHFSTEAIRTVLSHEEQVDIVIDTTGVPAVMEKGVQSLSVGGVAVWAGAVFTQPETPVNAEAVVRNLLTIKGIHNYIPEDLFRAINFITKCHSIYPFEELVGAEFALDDLDEAFALAKTGKYYRIGIAQ